MAVAPKLFAAAAVVVIEMAPMMASAMVAVPKKVSLLLAAAEGVVEAEMALRLATAVGGCDGGSGADTGKHGVRENIILKRF